MLHNLLVVGWRSTAVGDVVAVMWSCQILRGWVGKYQEFVV